MRILKDFITIDDLEKRWGLDKKQIESFTYERGDEPKLTMWYARKERARPDGGQSAFAEHARYLNGCIFDMADVLEMEKLNPELIQPATAENDEPKMMDGKFVFAEHQLIGKRDLYKRWFGATHEEITQHFDKGELRVYEHYKGPINCIIWCEQGHVHYQNRIDYSNHNLYDYNDEYCDYFLLEDVIRCETEHPEYIGDITPESLGLVEAISTVPTDKKIQIDEIRKALKMSPQKFVDFLNDDSNDMRLITSYEEVFRNFISLQGYSGSSAVPYFTVSMLENDDLTVHSLDWKELQERTKVIPPSGDNVFSMTTVDTSKIEAQLAEAQKQIESLCQWNKRLNEQNQKLRAELVAAQETQPFTVEPPTTVNAAKWESSVTAAFSVWADIIAGDKKDWKEDEFRTALAGRYNGYLTDVHTIAWRLLPKAFKHGPGRPKKNPENIQQSDIT